jgi:hypothetical protein
LVVVHLSVVVVAVLAILVLVELLEHVEGLLVEDDGRDRSRRRGDLGHELVVEGGAGGFGESGHGRGVGGDAHEETLESKEHVLAAGAVIVVLLLLLLVGEEGVLWGGGGGKHVWIVGVLLMN